jgi:hypothetical protein
MLRELAEKAKKIDVNKLALLVAQANAGLIPEKVRTQLDVGTNGAGAAVGKYTTRYYSNYKQRRGSNAPWGTVDLKLTGELYRMLDVEISEKDFKVESFVDYSKYQIKRYGKKIYELQKDNQKTIRDKNSVDIVKEYSRQLGL